MESASLPLRNRLKGVISSRNFWIVGAMLAGITFLHYLTPQVRFLPGTEEALGRHAVERMLFIIPVAGATFAFGQVAGLVTLVLAVLIMLPRVFLISPYPADAFTETAAVPLVGYLLIWMIETQEREKRLRQEAVSRLRAINAVTDILTGSLELEEILNSALEKVLEVTGLDGGLIFILDGKGEELNLAAYRGISPVTAEGVDRLRVGEGFCGRVAQTGEPMVVADTLTDERLTRVVVRKEGFQSQLIVPLKSKGRVRGAMALARRGPREFVADEIALISTIGNHIGVAIDNAQLHRDVARQLRIQQRLNEVAEEITSELELDKILPKVLQIAQELIGADGGAIALLDRERDLIGYPYLRNLPQKLAGLTVSKEEGLAWEVMTTGRPAVIEDYSTYPRAISAFVEAGVTSVVAVPIVSGDRSFGTLGLVSLDRTRSFSDRDVAILTGIGRQAGIAIENAHLYENMRFYVRQITRAQEEERKRIARELHDDTAQILVAFSRRLDALTTSPEPLPEPLRQRLEEFRELATNGLQSVRLFSKGLRPPALDDLGLLAALEGLKPDIEKEGIEVELKVLGPKQRLSSEVELALFRIVQEALNNVRRHSKASRVLVGVEFCESEVRVVIEDNGQGFEVPGRVVDLVATGKLGLTGMHERARLLGGTVVIQSEPGKGTKVTVDVPV